MDLKTIVLEGVEYLLVPTEMLAMVQGVEPEEPEEPEAPSLEDFTPPVIQGKKDSIVVVNTMPNVAKAEGTEYDFAKRLKERNLRPEDVMVIKTKFEDLPEIPEISQNDFKGKTPPGKWGFYGKGIERDIG